MTRPIVAPTPTAAEPFSPQSLLVRFGARSQAMREAVPTLFAALDADGRKAFRAWKTDFGRWAGRAVERLPLHLARLARKLGVSADPGEAAALLFAMQSYFALVVRLAAEPFDRGSIDVALPNSPAAWCLTSSSTPVGRLIERLRYSMADLQGAPPSDDGECDLFKPLYQDIFPRSLRHLLGEYYTPDWLAEHVLDQVGYTGEPGQRLLDPACGSGTFLLLALRRWRKRGEGRGAGGEGRDSGQWSVVGGQCAENDNHKSEIINHQSNSPPASRLPPPVAGFDLNPLAVLTARANYLIAMADLLPKQTRVELPIYLRDSILESDKSDFDRFDFVVGNPPWIAWDNLPDEDRQATKPLWERYGLFSLSGNEARHGGGKKDLSMLMIYAVADRYLKPSGKLGMVVSQSLFQTRGAGDGFRRFRLGDDGPLLKVVRVDDFTALRPFDDAAARAATMVLQKGEATAYPVPYGVWSGVQGARGGVRGMASQTPRDCNRGGEVLQLHCKFASPIDPAKPTSPWLVTEDANSPKRSRHTPCAVAGKLQSRAKQEDRHSCLSKTAGLTHKMTDRNVCPPDFAVLPCAVARPLLGDCEDEQSIAANSTRRLPAAYTAHLGANSGGANGVFWVEVLGEADGGVLVRNITAKSKRAVETVEQVIEPDLLYPLLRWGDVGRYSAVPRGHILLAQNPMTRTGVDETILRERFPRTLAYLEQFRDLLESRAAYRRYQSRSPFYSMYNVGPYTVAPIKVVWRRMDRRINAVVVETAHDDVLAKPAVPQETCVLVACDTSDEAHYLCAMLNSDEINELVAAHCVCGSKGFGTPGMLDNLPLARYCPDDPRHAELAAISRREHECRSGLPSRTDVV